MNEKTAYQVFDELRAASGMSVYTFCKESGISTSYMTQWKQGKVNPKPEKLQKIADFFGVPLAYFYSDATQDPYYVDPETAVYAEELRTNPELKAVFDVARDMPKEKLEAIYNLLKNM